MTRIKFLLSAGAAVLLGAVFAAGQTASTADRPAVKAGEKHWSPGTDMPMSSYEHHVASLQPPR
jgi:hypothetical protein